jgi:hypothetical protein
MKMPELIMAPQAMQKTSMKPSCFFSVTGGGRSRDLFIFYPGDGRDQGFSRTPGMAGNLYPQVRCKGAPSRRKDLNPGSMRPRSLPFQPVNHGGGMEEERSKVPDEYGVSTVKALTRARTALIVYTG